MVEAEKKNKNKKTKKHKKDDENVIVNRLFDGRDKQTLFEEMFSLLLHEPKYLAKLAHKCSIGILFTHHTIPCFYFEIKSRCL